METKATRYTHGVHSPCCPNHKNNRQETHPTWHERAGEESQNSRPAKMERNVSGARERRNWNHSFSRCWFLSPSLHHRRTFEPAVKSLPNRRDLVYALISTWSSPSRYMKKNEELWFDRWCWMIGYGRWWILKIKPFWKVPHYDLTSWTVIRGGKMGQISIFLTYI